ncbi:MAG: M48 family metalloprotease [Fibrobacter sp.]|nr:M48 family metalloprotease [Fibrobacter sp.]
MSAAEWVLTGALLLEFGLRLGLEIREARMVHGKFDRFTAFRILPVVNDVFPAEANFTSDNGGAFVNAHEKAHGELHHGFVRRSLQFGFALFCALSLGAAGVYLRFNLLELLLLFHLIFAVAKIGYHMVCFTEEYEADFLAAKRVQRGVATRALEALLVKEFPRTPLFAYVYRTHPTAQMRLDRIVRTCKKSRR